MAEDGTSAEYLEHARWLNEVYEEYGRMDRSSSSFPHDRAAHGHSLPSVPTSWPGTDVVESELRDFSRAIDFGEENSGFYRSYGGALDYEQQDFGLAEVDFEEPVYRGFSHTIEAVGGNEHAFETGLDPADEVADSSVDADWLSCMPPLIRRQNAERSTLIRT